MVPLHRSWLALGKPPNEILTQIDEWAASCTVGWDNEGCKVLGYPGSFIDPIVNHAFQLMLVRNINRIGQHFGNPNGKPTELGFEGGQALENAVIGLLLELCGVQNASEEDFSGNLEACGTAANLQGLRIGRNYLLDRLGKPLVWFDKIALLTTVTAHFSVFKDAGILGFELPPEDDEPVDKFHNVHLVPADRQGRMSTVALGEKIQQLQSQGYCGFLVVANAGTTLTGAVDDVRAIRSELDRLCGEDCYLHVDAAFGGFVLPFLNPEQRFGFDYGADSVVIDPHKMGGVPFGCGVFLCRSKFMRYALIKAPYINSEVDYTFAGSGNAAFAAACYATILVEGREGFQRRITACLATRDYLVNRLHDIRALNQLNCWEVIAGTTNQACLMIDGEPNQKLQELLKGYFLHAASVPSDFSQPDNPSRRYAVKFVCMPHVTTKLIDNFADEAEGLWRI